MQIAVINALIGQTLIDHIEFRKAHGGMCPAGRILPLIAGSRIVLIKISKPVFRSRELFIRFYLTDYLFLLIIL